MLKRGYDKGIKTVEFIDGNVDLVLYNNAETSFYFFRLKQDVLLEQGFVASDFIYPSYDITYKDEMVKYLDKASIDYDVLCGQILEFASENQYNERYEM